MLQSTTTLFVNDPLFFAQAQRKGLGAETQGLRASNLVQVLNIQHVGGYDAVVLSADDPDALQQWLQSHGYEAQPELIAWLAPYIQAHWKITAFKVSNNDQRNHYSALSAVEMTFTTSHPFYPYREPANQRASGNYGERGLRVFVLSADRMAGTLGEAALPDSWPGRLFSASPLTDAQRDAVTKAFALPAASFPSKLWLTTFEDHSSPRPGTDEIYFAPAQEQTVVIPPPITVTRVQPLYVPIEPLVLVAGAGVFFWRRRKRSSNLPSRQ